MRLLFVYIGDDAVELVFYNVSLDAQPYDSNMREERKFF